MKRSRIDGTLNLRFSRRTVITSDVAVPSSPLKATSPSFLFPLFTTPSGHRPGTFIQGYLQWIQTRVLHSQGLRILLTDLAYGRGIRTRFRSSGSPTPEAAASLPCANSGEKARACSFDVLAFAVPLTNHTSGWTEALIQHKSSPHHRSTVFIFTESRWHSARPLIPSYY